MENLTYPQAERGLIVDDYHGTVVADPYRWLETDSEATQAWIASQNDLARSWLATPERARIRQDLEAHTDFETWSAPVRRQDYLFSFHGTGSREHSILVRTGPDGVPVDVFDPASLSEDGSVQLGRLGLSKDGELLAYSSSVGGQDRVTWRVRDLSTGTDLPDTIEDARLGGVTWAPDQSGLWYGRFPEGADPDELTNYRVMFHTLGTHQSEDVVFYARPEHPDHLFGRGVTDDGGLFVIYPQRGSDENQVVLIDLTTPDREPLNLVDDWEAEWTLVGKRGRMVWMYTTLDAPMGRVLRVDLDRPQPEAWVEVLPQGDEPIAGLSLIGERLFVETLKDAHSAIKIHDLSGEQVGVVDLPGIGTVSGFGGTTDDKEIFYSFSSFTQPESVYRYDVATNTSTLHWRPDLDFDPGAYTASQVWVTSADGTRFPMFLVHRSGLELDGSNPTLIYGYGGFGTSLGARFSASLLPWLELGGVYAQPTLRGGGEYGDAWHEAGTLAGKQRVFEDAIAAAEWLVAEGYTRPDKLAIRGSSNGGLLVSAVAIQRPDLFGAALPRAGVHDMLRYQHFTLGPQWAGEYGLSDDPEQFRTLLAYSPLHNATRARYPAFLITAADHDDRVVPAHSYKLAAALQHAQSGPAPILIHVDRESGHSGVSGRSRKLDALADRYAFLVRALDIDTRSTSTARTTSGSR